MGVPPTTRKKKDTLSVTELKEAKLVAHQDQLASLQNEVAALRNQLRHAQRLAAIGTMTAMVVHEFNNILTPIISYAQLAQTNPGLVDKAISHAADGGRRATDICSAILAMTRGEPGQSEEVSLGEMVQQMLGATGREPKRDGIDLVVDIADDLTISTRRVELQQVLLNLFINARAAVMSKRHPRGITISAEKIDAGTTIRVSDTGIGIPTDCLEKIFQPFFTTKDDGDAQGHGLGLAISQEIVTDLGGRISVQAAENEGATFTVYLPN